MSLRSVRLLVLVCLAAAVAACASTGGPIIATGPRYEVSAADGNIYRLGAGDKVRISVYNEPTLSGEFQIGTTGIISFPLVGDISADGKTPNEVAAAVQARLADGYLREPRVSAEITGYRPFFILGAVTSPGQYPYAAGLTALNAIATAQGFTPRANSHVVYIRRAGAVVEEAYRLTPDLRVSPGDTIRIGERYF